MGGQVHRTQEISLKSRRERAVILPIALLPGFRSCTEGDAIYMAFFLIKEELNCMLTLARQAMHLDLHLTN